MWIGQLSLNPTMYNAPPFSLSVLDNFIIVADHIIDLYTGKVLIKTDDITAVTRKDNDY